MDSEVKVVVVLFLFAAQGGVSKVASRTTLLLSLPEGRRCT